MSTGMALFDNLRKEKCVKERTAPADTYMFRPTEVEPAHLHMLCRVPTSPDFIIIELDMLRSWQISFLAVLCSGAQRKGMVIIMKKILYYLLAVSLILSMSITASASEAFVNVEVPVQGTPVYCENLVLLDDGNYYCVLVETVEDESAIEPFSYPERQKTKTFIHSVNDRNGTFLATLTVTVSGVYSEVEQSAVITSVVASYSNAQISGLSYSVSYNGNTAKLNILLNGLGIGSVSYKLYTNGSLQTI